MSVATAIRFFCSACGKDCGTRCYVQLRAPEPPFSDPNDLAVERFVQVCEDCR